MGGTGTGRSGSRRAVLACFFLSGMAGLIYEVVWARQLSLFLGITSFAHTAVITAYMAGLAAGSLYFGRRADRAASPLRVYAWLELGICAYAMLTPFLFDALQSGYAGLAGVAGVSGMPAHLARFAIALAALLVPTFLMGGTLPLLVRGFVSSLPELGGATSRLYGINTLGAMAGTLLAGYLLLPKFGILIATLAGVVVNLGIAIYIIAVTTPGPNGPGTRFVATETGPAEPAGELSLWVRPAVLAGFAMAGFAALLTQMAWIRAMILVVGGSVYAFTITLASFLAGIGLGSLLYRWLAPRHGLGRALQQSRLARAAVLAALIGFALVAGLPLIGRLPHWFLAGFAAIGADRFALFQLFIFALSFGVMIVPTLLMGALFPLITVVWTRSNERAAGGVGAAYAINTTGTILGALLGGLLILPAIGVQRSVLLAASFYLLAAVLFWWPGSAGMGLLRRLGGLAAVPLFLLAASQVPPWDRALMASGVYYRADATLALMKEQSLEEIIAESELLYYDEGLDGTVTVRRSDGERSLAVNGKTDASSSGDLPTQVLLGQIPLNMDREISNAMVIGLGSGITAGSIATDPRIESLTVLEISDEVVSASDWFLPENYGVLEDPRVRLVTADARNFLLASDQRYELIVSEPSNPWISGVSNLFTAEFFALAHERLTPGGLMTQWFHTYGMSPADFRTVLATFAQEFPHVSIWQSLPGDLIMVGSDEPHGLQLGRVPWQDREHGLTREMNRARLFSDRDLVRLYLLGGGALQAYTAGARLNSDRHPVVEFNAPRNLYAATELMNLELMFEFLRSQDLSVPVRRLLALTDNAIEATAFDARVAAPAGGVIDVQSAHWLISHRRFADGEREWGVGSQRRLVWQENGDGYYLQAEWQYEAPGTEALDQLLGVLMIGQRQEVGGAEVPGQVGAARWSVHVEPVSGRSRIGLAWPCAAPTGGVTVLVAAKTLPEGSEPDWQQHLQEFTGRFSCR